jgi:hypothetical protein
MIAEALVGPGTRSDANSVTGPPGPGLRDPGPGDAASGTRPRGRGPRDAESRKGHLSPVSIGPASVNVHTGADCVDPLTDDSELDPDARGHRGEHPRRGRPSQRTTRHEEMPPSRLIRRHIRSSDWGMLTSRSRSAQLSSNDRRRRRSPWRSNRRSGSRCTQRASWIPQWTTSRRPVHCIRLHTSVSMPRGVAISPRHGRSASIKTSLDKRTVDNRRGPPIGPRRRAAHHQSWMPRRPSGYRCDR